MDMQNCIEACLTTHRLCAETAAHVLHGDGKAGHDETAHLVALMDCAQITITSVDFMARRSPHHTHVCAECAEICEACAKLCEGHPNPDGQMKRCAEACRHCAETCRAMGQAR